MSAGFFFSSCYLDVECYKIYKLALKLVFFAVWQRTIAQTWTHAYGFLLEMKVVTVSGQQSLFLVPRTWSDVARNCAVVPWFQRPGQSCSSAGWWCEEGLVTTHFHSWLWNESAVRQQIYLLKSKIRINHNFVVNREIEYLPVSFFTVK